MHKDEMQQEETAVIDSKTIDGQAAIAIASPLPAWPGHIFIPRDLSPDQFDQWWVSFNEEAPDGCTPERKAFMDRQHLVLEWHIEGVEPHHVTSDGGKLPTAKLFGFVVAATSPLINEARSLPNLPGWWNAPVNGGG